MTPGGRPASGLPAKLFGSLLVVDPKAGMPLDVVLALLALRRVPVLLEAGVSAGAAHAHQERFLADLSAALRLVSPHEDPGRCPVS